MVRMFAAAALAALAALVTSHALAQAYPSRRVRLIRLSLPQGGTIVKSTRWMIGAALAVAAPAPGAQQPGFTKGEAVVLATYAVETGKPVASPAK